MTPILDRDPEFIATITAIYQDELGRAPDPAGLANWVQRARDGWTGEEIRRAIHVSDEAVAYRARPTVPHLEIRGRNFVDVDGHRVVFAGVDQFRAFRQFLDGEDLAPLFAESRALGVTLWRVFLMGSKAQNGLLDLRPSEPDFYGRLRAFADLLNAHGIVLLATVFVDNQDVKADLAHWTRVADTLRGTATLLSGGNEFKKNGFDPRALPDPGLLWSRGSDLGDEPPVKPAASFMEFHPRRDFPKSLMDAAASPLWAYYQGGYPTVPFCVDEPPRMGTDGSGDVYADPTVCEQFGRIYGALCGFACFHSRSGQKGVPMDEPTRACAAAFVKGLIG